MRFKAILLLVILGLAVAVLPAHAAAYGNIPAFVRIGLYTDSQGSAAQTCRVYCADGVIVGYAHSGGSTHLYDFALESPSSPMGFNDYIFEKKFAVVTGRDDGSVAAAAGRVANLREKGFEPRLAYLNGWVLIVGLYDSMDAASQAMNSDFAGLFPNYGFAAESLSGAYTRVSIGTTQQFIYESTVNNLQVWPAKAFDPPAPGGANKPVLIEFNGKPYRGAIEIVNKLNVSLSAVNYVAINDYLYGVVPREIQSSSPADALKAQAVAARTYAVNSVGKHGSNGYDLCATTHCQVYGGYEAEDARAVQAVNDTSGMVVLFNGAPASVFYFSSSGGHTADVRHVWDSMREYPYLKGVEDKYESGQSHLYEWEITYTAAEIKSILANSKINIGDITGVAVTKSTPDGRAIEVTISGTEGSKVYVNGACRTMLKGMHSQVYTVFAVSPGDPPGVVDGKQYNAVGRNGVNATVSGGTYAVGADNEPVTLKGGGGAAVSDTAVVNLPASGSVFSFVGRGWGHGVGMSQEGARGMAGAGFTYKEILIHYFPGCTVG